MVREFEIRSTFGYCTVTVTPNGYKGAPKNLGGNFVVFQWGPSNQRSTVGQFPSLFTTRLERVQYSGAHCGDLLKSTKSPNY